MKNASLIIATAPGTGKKFMFDKAMNEIGQSYKVFDGSMKDVSVLEFVEFLEKNHDSVIVLDQCEELMRNIGFNAAIKAAIDGFVYYNTIKAKKEFQFDGKIVILTNDTKVSMAIADRSLIITDVSAITPKFLSVVLF